MLSPRVRAQSGLTIVELMVSATLLLVGALATFALVDTANSTTNGAASREVATNVARQVLEDARASSYTTIGQANWLKPKLEALQSDAGAHAATPAGAAAQQTTVVRRGITYTVAVAPCTVDDVSDKYGTHASSITWCSDSTGTNNTSTNDSQPEDLKRVAATISWTMRGKSYTVKRTATFSSSGVAIGPSTTLAVQAPAGLGSPPVVSSASTTSITFRGTSIGAADMKFMINGAEQQTNITNNLNGTWDWTWNIAGLPDGAYTIGAVAVDALGTRGQPYTMQVTLNRNVPAALAGLAGGYNYVFSGGTKKLVVELAWDANVEGNVTGYEVLRGATSVCGGQTSQATECLDLNAPAGGTTTYTVKTWYRNALGALQSISTNYNVTAPGTGGTIATRYYYRYDTSNQYGTYTGSTCKDAIYPSSGLQNKYDMLSGVPNFTGVTVGFSPASGCIPPLPAGAALTAGTFSFTAKWVNTSNKNNCTGLPVYLYLNGTTIIAGSGIGGGNTLSIPAKTNTQTQFVVSGTTTARSFSPGDQLSVHTPGAAFSANCSAVTFYMNNTTTGQAFADIPLAITATPLPQPSPPTGLTATPNGDGTTTLTWTNATGTPAPDFYRIYRDGQNYTNRVDTAGTGPNSTVTWIDTSTGGTAHTYYVTTVASTLAESSTMAGPVSG